MFMKHLVSRMCALTELAERINWELIHQLISISDYLKNPELKEVCLKQNGEEKPEENKRKSNQCE